MSIPLHMFPKDITFNNKQTLKELAELAKKLSECSSEFVIRPRPRDFDEEIPKENP